MPQISLIEDYYNLYTPEENDAIVEAIADYVPVYAEIHFCIHNNETLNVIVRNRTCGNWLRRMKQKYGENWIRSEKYTPKSIIKEKWSVLPPAWVSDSAIMRSGLLEYDIQAKENQSFEDVILEHFFSPYMTYKRFPVPQIAELLMDFEPEKWTLAQQLHIVKSIFRKQLRMWKKKAKVKRAALSVESEMEERLIDQLRDGPQELQKILTKYKLIKNYPNNMQRRVLRDWYKLLSQLEPNVEEVPVDEFNLKEVRGEIAVYFHSRVSDINEAIESVSGHLMIEFNLVKKMLLSLEEAVTDDLVAKIQNKFRPLQVRVPSELKTLEKLIEPPYPSEPDKGWTAEKWTKWAVTEYLPYRFWLEERGKTDENTARYAEMYGDWFYEHYLNLLYHHKQMLHKAFINAKEKLIESEYALIIVIDNFNLKFFPVLEALLRTKGFMKTDAENYLTLIPSETSLCKRCLFAGQPSNKDIHGNSYEDILAKEWAGYFADKKIIYLSNPGDLKSLEKIDHQIYLLNYLMVDNILHNSEDELGQPHASSVKHYLKGLVETIYEFAQKFKISDKLSIFIVSDHGSTKISAELPNIIDEKFFRERCDDKRHRFITLSSAEFEGLSENHKNQCYFLDKERYGNDENYLITRGYYRFIKTDSSFYVHGGVTPEETIVPFAVFQKTAESVEKPKISLLDNLFRYAVKSFIKLEIVNPNDISFENVQLEVESPEISYEPTSLDELPAQSVVQQKIPCRFPKSIETNSLSLILRFEYGGEEQKFSYEFPIEMRALMESSWDDLFN